MEDEKNGLNRPAFNSRIQLLPQLNPEKVYKDTRSDTLVNYLKEIAEVCAHSNNPVAYLMNDGAQAELYTLAGMFRHIKVVGVSGIQAYPKYSEKHTKPSFMRLDDFEKRSLEWSAIVSNKDNTKNMTLQETNSLLSKLDPERGILVAIYETKNKDGVNITFYKNNIKRGSYYTELTLYDKAENHKII